MTVNSSPQIRALAVRPATVSGLAPYGELLGYRPDVLPAPIDFYGGTARVRRVANFVSDEDTEMPVVTLQRRPFEVRWVERHFKHTQVFIPLGGKPFVAVFAPPTDSELPDIDAFEAFQFDGQAGFVMKLGCWHDFPFPLEDDSHMIVILRKEATEGLMQHNVMQNEAQSPDLDKKDLLQRKNLVLRLAV